MTGRPIRGNDGTRWTCTGSRFVRWRTLVAEFGPLTEETRP